MPSEGCHHDFVRWERQGFIASIRNGVTDAYRVEEDDGWWVRLRSETSAVRVDLWTRGWVGLLDQRDTNSGG